MARNGPFCRRLPMRDTGSGASEQTPFWAALRPCTRTHPLCMAAVQQVQRWARRRQHAMGQGQDRQGPARGLRLAMPGSDCEDAGFNTQELANTLRTMAKIRRIRLEVFDSLCQAVATKMRDLNAPDVANTRWAMAKIGRVLPEVFDSLCQAATVKMLASIRRSLPEVFDSLCQAATVKMPASTRRVLPEVFNSLCQAATVKILASTRSDGEDAGFGDKHRPSNTSLLCTFASTVSAANASAATTHGLHSQTAQNGSRRW